MYHSIFFLKRYFSKRFIFSETENQNVGEYENFFSLTVYSHN